MLMHDDLGGVDWNELHDMEIEARNSRFMPAGVALLNRTFTVDDDPVDIFDFLSGDGDALDFYDLELIVALNVGEMLVFGGVGGTEIRRIS